MKKSSKRVSTKAKAKLLSTPIALHLKLGWIFKLSWLLLFLGMTLMFAFKQHSQGKIDLCEWICRRTGEKLRIRIPCFILQSKTVHAYLSPVPQKTLHLPIETSKFRLETLQRGVCNSDCETELLDELSH